VVVLPRVVLIASVRMIDLANSSMMSVHALMIGLVAISVIAMMIVAVSMITVTVVNTVNVVMSKAAVMVVAIKGEDMMMTALAVMMMIVVVAMMMKNVMVIGVDGVIVNLLRMSTPPVRFALFMGTLLVTVGGAMVILLVVMEIVETKMPTSLV
jgi:hypothetical protein